MQDLQDGPQGQEMQNVQPMSMDPTPPASARPAPAIPGPGRDAGSPTPRSGRRHRRRERIAVVGALVLLLALTAPSGFAAEIEDVSFPDQVRVGDRQLPLFGLGLLRYRILFRGYVGALYLPEELAEKARVAAVLSDVPKALELRYFWDIEGRLFGEAANELLAESLPARELASLRDRLDRLHALYRDVAPGDRYRLSYAPGEGTTLAYNGTPLGTIEGADFARAYFGIWLGPKPLSESFRDQLLEGR